MNSSLDREIKRGHEGNRFRLLTLLCPTSPSLGQADTACGAVAGTLLPLLPGSSPRSSRGPHAVPPAWAGGTARQGSSLFASVRPQTTPLQPPLHVQNPRFLVPNQQY